MEGWVATPVERQVRSLAGQIIRTMLIRRTIDVKEALDQSADTVAALVEKRAVDIEETSGLALVVVQIADSARGTVAVEEAFRRTVDAAWRAGVTVLIVPAAFLVVLALPCLPRFPARASGSASQAPTMATTNPPMT